MDQGKRAIESLKRAYGKGPAESVSAGEAVPQEPGGETAAAIRERIRRIERYRTARSSW